MSTEGLSIKIRYSSLSPSLSGTLVDVYTANRPRTTLEQWENTINSFNGVAVLTSSTTEEPELSVVSSKDAAANFPQLVQVQSVIPSGVLQQHHPLWRTNHQAWLLNIKREICAIKHPLSGLFVDCTVEIYPMSYLSLCCWRWPSGLNRCRPVRLEGLEQRIPLLWSTPNLSFLASVNKNKMCWKASIKSQIWVKPSQKQ